MYIYIYIPVWSPQILEKREKAAVDQAQKQMQSINLNVSGDVQALFDRLSFMYYTIVIYIFLKNH